MTNISTQNISNKNTSTQNTPQQLNVMSLPLVGERLIEASAGTGKTYTIAGLYLRLLLGHGGDNAHPRPLSVDEILVVTFTEAATSELRDRIRSRIVQTRQAFIAGFSDDPLISQLLDSVVDHKQAEQLLLNAVRQMDEAAIFTIHGFCQRMLKEHAFESGSYFETEFITEQADIRTQAIEDFWREHFYHTNSASDFMLAKLVASLYQSPQDLLRDITRYLTDPYLQFNAPLSQTSLTQSLDSIISEIDSFKSKWLAAYGEIATHLKESGVDKRSYSTRNLPKWLDEVTDWAQQQTTSIILPKSLEKFDSAILVEKTKKGAAPSLPIFDDVHKFRQTDVDLKPAILAKAIHYTRAHVTAHKKQQSLMSFDDLLVNLSSALDHQVSPQAETLASKIRTQYPLAMIDEFQDTDLMQYQIFSTIYGQQAAAGLLMIGDPKQAIYSFRGADIFTYIKARNSVENHYTLGTNYRSTPDMVAATNALFEQAEAPFIYRDDIGFSAVKSVPTATTFTIDDKPQGAISQWLVDGEDTLSNGDYQAKMALACANQINDILTKANHGHAGFEKDGELRPVKASDIAVLVRTGREAQMVKEQLSKQGIASVYLSNRDSIFASSLVQDCARLLHAIANPNDGRAIRSAMATPLMAQSLLQLERLNNDEQAWQQLVDECHYYLGRWQRVGVLAMLREFMHQQQLPSQLLSQPNGERQLTDLMHLGEILQQQSLEIVGEHALLHWLGDQINNVGQENQEQQLRLESDNNLVQIVTIHKSKGLEYNLVFLPFICSARSAKEPIYHQDDKCVVDLTFDSDSIAAADKERLAEDLRLFYVAITRAVHHAWLGFAPVKSGVANKAKTTDLHKTAVGYLYLGSEETNASALKTRLEEISAQHSQISLCLPPLEAMPRYQQQEVTNETLVARHFEGEIENNYWITSYSALSKSSHSHNEQDIDASVESLVIDWEEALANVDANPLEQMVEQSVFSFPRGADAGTFLHTLFEEIDFSEQNPQVFSDKVSELLAQSEFDEDWQPILLKLIDDVLNTPLVQRESECQLPPNFTLSMLTMQDKQVEMEFFMPIESLNAGQLNRCLAKHDPLSKQGAPLGFSDVKGMLKGFIDLVFIADGKYYVLDYKSNHLGDERSDYSMDAMTNMMIDHRYDFQYQLYSLALHRLLKSRMADYDFETHFGGVFYLFVRGMDKTSDGGEGIFYNRPSKAFIEELDALFNADTIDAGALS
ncbi:exodeoxyribonuclease V subunit beta [Psychrobium sp. MM17-31]|uniref:exodeoxyribonuclease V subunit beta n=1 Tax=Psychrobium sp. MM17-31 TaxID=2917758 RepID=UPI001EF52F98|nr:exodeoxyribonuclease V subunit beta [Psychrobium sp. MM17-31]MCG7532102.1 exodeoxyribonuclease V subunit beta [Psychrobium sp. MM17-31]